VRHGRAGRSHDQSSRSAGTGDGGESGATDDGVLTVGDDENPDPPTRRPAGPGNRCRSPATTATTSDSTHHRRRPTPHTTDDDRLHTPPTTTDSTHHRRRPTPPTTDDVRLHTSRVWVDFGRGRPLDDGGRRSRERATAGSERV
jgi:hypothetical protein